MTNEKRIGVENTHTQTKLYDNYVDDKFFKKLFMQNLVDQRGYQSLLPSDNS